MAYVPVPGSQTTASSSLAHLATVFYRKKALDRLQTKFLFQSVCMDDMLPRMSGRTIQFFRYTNLAANTTVKAEGTVGTSLGIQSKTVSATVSQYTNFITVSDLLKDTAIDPIVQGAAELLGYQAGLSVDTITRVVIDAEQASTDLPLLSTYLRAQDFRNARHQLQAKDVQPDDDGYFQAIAHPYTTFDLVNDPAANGLADIYKYTNPEKAGLIRNEDRGVIGIVGNCRVRESTNVAAIAGSPNKWRTYIFGKGAVGCVDLEGRGPNKVMDPKKQRFNIRVINNNNDNLADPEGVIGAAVSYNFAFAVVVLQGPTGIGGSYRYRTMECPSTIAA